MQPNPAPATIPSPFGGDCTFASPLASHVRSHANKHHTAQARRSLTAQQLAAIKSACCACGKLVSINSDGSPRKHTCDTLATPDATQPAPATPIAAQPVQAAPPAAILPPPATVGAAPQPQPTHTPTFHPILVGCTHQPIPSSTKSFPNTKAWAQGFLAPAYAAYSATHACVNKQCAALAYKNILRGSRQYSVLRNRPAGAGLPPALDLDGDAVGEPPEGEGDLYDDAAAFYDDPLPDQHTPEQLQIFQELLGQVGDHNILRALHHLERRELSKAKRALSSYGHVDLSLAEVKTALNDLLPRFDPLAPGAHVPLVAGDCPVATTEQVEAFILAKDPSTGLLRWALLPRPPTGPQTRSRPVGCRPHGPHRHRQ